MGPGEPDDHGPLTADHGPANRLGADGSFRSIEIEMLPAELEFPWCLLANDILRIHFHILSSFLAGGFMTLVSIDVGAVGGDILNLVEIWRVAPGVVTTTRNKKNKYRSHL